MSDWKAGMAFDSILQTPLDYYDVTYANGHTVRYEKERPHGEWIPCSERLPHAECGESNSVLCQLENDTMKVLYWNGGNWCNPTGELYHSVNHKNGWHNRVIAWMPLPERYKEEGDENG